MAMVVKLQDSALVPYDGRFSLLLLLIKSETQVQIPKPIKFKVAYSYNNLQIVKPSNTTVKNETGSDNESVQLFQDTNSSSIDVRYCTSSSAKSVSSSSLSSASYKYSFHGQKRKADMPQVDFVPDQKKRKKLTTKTNSVNCKTKKYRHTCTLSKKNKQDKFENYSSSSLGENSDNQKKVCKRRMQNNTFKQSGIRNLKGKSSDENCLDARRPYRYKTTMVPLIMTTGSSASSDSDNISHKSRSIRSGSGDVKINFSNNDKRMQKCVSKAEIIKCIDPEEDKSEPFFISKPSSVTINLFNKGAEENKSDISLKEEKQKIISNMGTRQTYTLCDTEFKVPTPQLSSNSSESSASSESFYLPKSSESSDGEDTTSNLNISSNESTVSSKNQHKSYSSSAKKTDKRKITKNVTESTQPKIACKEPKIKVQKEPQIKEPIQLFNPIISEIVKRGPGRPSIRPKLKNVFNRRKTQDVKTLTTISNIESLKSHVDISYDKITFVESTTDEVIANQINDEDEINLSLTKNFNTCSTIFLDAFEQPVESNYTRPKNESDLDSISKTSEKELSVFSGEFKSKRNIYDKLKITENDELKPLGEDFFRGVTKSEVALKTPTLAMNTFSDDPNQFSALQTSDFEPAQQLNLLPVVTSVTPIVFPPFESYFKPNTSQNSQSPRTAAATALAHPSINQPPLIESSQSTAVTFTNQQQQQQWSHGHHTQQQHQYYLIQPPPVPFGFTDAVSIAQSIADLPSADLFQKRVNAISEALRQVSFKQSDNQIPEILSHLRQQNSLLLSLCNDLSDELLVVQTRKADMNQKFEAVNDIANAHATVNAVACDNATPSLIASTVSTNLAPVTEDGTGGSSAFSDGGSAGEHNNVIVYTYNYSDSSNSIINSSNQS